MTDENGHVCDDRCAVSGSDPDRTFALHVRDDVPLAAHLRFLEMLFGPLPTASGGEAGRG